MNPLAQDYQTEEYRQLSTPELYHQRESLYAARAKADDPGHRSHIKRQMSRMARVLNKRELPTRQDDYLGGLHLWRNNYDYLSNLAAHVTGRKLQKQQFVEAMKKVFLPAGHTYRIYVHFRRYADGTTLFRDVVAMNLIELSTPGSCYTKIGELEL